MKKKHILFKFIGNSFSIKNSKTELPNNKIIFKNWKEENMLFPSEFRVHLIEGC